jgi:hypothetical protein
LTSHKFIRLRKRIVNVVTNTPIIKIKMNWIIQRSKCVFFFFLSLSWKHSSINGLSSPSSSFFPSNRDESFSNLTIRPILLWRPPHNGELSTWSCY